MVLTIKAKCKEYALHEAERKLFYRYWLIFLASPPHLSPLLIRFFSQIQRRLPGFQSSTWLFFGFIVWETPAMSSFLAAIKSCTIYIIMHSAEQIVD